MCGLWKCSSPTIEIYTGQEPVRGPGLRDSPETGPVVPPLSSLSPCPVNEGPLRGFIVPSTCLLESSVCVRVYLCLFTRSLCLSVLVSIHDTD